jgi:hypothetical protein
MPAPVADELGAVVARENDDVIDLRIPGITDAREIGRGGFATVYRADSTTSGEVAVKVLRSVDDEQTLRRFENELSSVQRLRGDPNVVQLLDSGTSENGHSYLVMPYLDRGSLEDEIATVGPQPWKTVLADMSQVAAAVQRAHDTGLVHRDIKPSNLLRAEDGTPQLADFGIAREFGDTSSIVSTSITATPAYSAPEQFETGKSTKASDVYGIASSAYAMIAGSPPYLARGEEVTLLTLMKRVTEEPVPDLRPAIPDELHRLFERAMHKDAAKRPSAGELAAEFERLTTAEVSYDPNATIQRKRVPAQTSTAVEPGSTRVRLVLMLAIGALFLLGGGAVLFSLLGGSDSAEVRGTVVDDITPPIDVVVQENGPNEEGTQVEVSVEWDWEGAPGEAPPQGFLIYRTREDGINPLPTDVGSETNQVQVDTKFQFGHTYCVSVAAYRTRNELSERSPEQCVTTPPAAPGPEKIDTGELPTAGYLRPEPPGLVPKNFGLTAFWLHDNPETVHTYDIELLRDGEVIFENFGYEANGFNPFDFFIYEEDTYCVRITPQNPTGAGEPLEECLNFTYPE